MKNQTNTVLRIDNDTYNQIKNLAKIENRSINKQILYMLRKYLTLILK